MKNKTKINQAILHFEQKSRDLFECAFKFKNDFEQIKDDRNEMRARMITLYCELEFVQEAFNKMLKTSRIKFNLK